MFFGTSSGGPCLLPEHILAGPGALDRASYNELPVGIGPFRYVRWKRGDVVEFAANPNYFRGRPRLDTIVYKIIPDRNTLLAQMISGEVDLWLFPPRTYVDRLRAGSGIEVAEGIGAGVVFELLNERRPILNDRRVRRALLLADDREAVSRIFTHGRVPIGDALFPPGNPLYTDIGRTGHDPGRARAELAAAGWQLGPDGIRQKNGTRLTLHVATATGTEDFDQRIELLRQSYHEVGIELLVHHYPSSVLFGALGSGGILANGKFDLAPVGQLFSEPSDAASLFGCGMEPPRGFNFTGSCDPMLDRAMERLLDDYDVKRQRDDAIAVERRFAERLPALVDGYTQTFHAFGKGLRNFHPNPLVPLDDMMAVTI
jgi:peptide/nickel transport system substrate-binding protein